MKRMSKLKSIKSNQDYIKYQKQRIKVLETLLLEEVLKTADLYTEIALLKKAK